EPQPKGRLKPARSASSSFRWAELQSFQVPAHPAWAILRRRGMYDVPRLPRPSRACPAVIIANSEAVTVVSFLKRAIFPNRKIMENRKPPSEREVAEWLAKGRLDLPPLRFRLTKAQSRIPNKVADLEVEGVWDQATA